MAFGCCTRICRHDGRQAENILIFSLLGVLVYWGSSTGPRTRTPFFDDFDFAVLNYVTYTSGASCWCMKKFKIFVLVRVINTLPIFPAVGRRLG
jgi:hypothetical protein